MLLLYSSGGRGKAHGRSASTVLCVAKSQRGAQVAAGGDCSRSGSSSPCSYPETQACPSQSCDPPRAMLAVTETGTHWGQAPSGRKASRSTC